MNTLFELKLQINMIIIVGGLCHEVTEFVLHCLGPWKVRFEYSCQVAICHVKEKISIVRRGMLGLKEPKG